MDDSTPIPSARTVARQTAGVLLALATVGAGLFYAADRFARYEVAEHARRRSVPRVDSVRPSPLAGPVRPGEAFRVDLFLPSVGFGLDADTLAGDAVRLLDDAGRPVPAALNAAGDGGSVTLTPARPLEPGRTYRLRITRDLKDERGEPFEPHESTFEVAGESREISAALPGVAYGRIDLPQRLPRSKFTVLKFGPGGDLFAGTADGRIFRYAVNADGTLAERGVLNVATGGPRVVTGLAFDPRDGGRTLWVSHGVAALVGADDFTGRISTLSGDGYGTLLDRVVGLPRAFKDHLNFALAFDPRDPTTLFLSQGSNTAVGAPDSKWNHRLERPLTAAILKIDLDKLPADGPLDVATPTPVGDAFAGGDYDPLAPGAAVVVHATGVRSGYDLLFHSNGRLYTAINGAGRGGNTPAAVDARTGEVRSGPVMAVAATTADILADLTRPGGYHGHPNPARGERVLMGGNPTADRDPHEVSGYPVGLRPEPRWVRPAIDLGLGQSVNGLHESVAPVFGGAIRGRVFAARLSAGDDLVLLDVAAGTQTVGIPGLTGLASPLDVAEHPATGDLYVIEFDTAALVLLRPRDPAAALATTDAAPAAE